MNIDKKFDIQMESISKLLENDKLDEIENSRNLRKQILTLVTEYYMCSHSKKQFVKGKSIVPVSGRVYDEHELKMLISSALDFWLTAGRFNNEFEKQLSTFLGTKFAITTNSGSSANLLAVSSLTSEQLGNRSIKSGDEIITVAAGFPTTVNPILQNSLIPVFVDIDIPTYVINCDLIEEAITEKTKAIVLAHTLGNSFNIERILQLAKKYNLWIIEDCCDALGTTYDGKYVGTFGDLATFSFYPAHHITMGEGGAVVTNNPQLKRIVESFRDWGRDCFCEPGKSNTCGKRFEWNLGDLPFGYDHKYIYSHVGYNLKITEMQAAIGLAQIQKLPEFIKQRKTNFEFLKHNLKFAEDVFILPEHTDKSDPSWFGFPITIKNNAPFSRTELINYLNQKLIDTRPIFAGNLVKQPYLKSKNYRISSKLEKTDIVMTSSFWIGVYPGLTTEMLEYVVKEIKNFIDSKRN